MNPTSGIYQIRNLTNGKRYIGQSSNVFKRWMDGKSALIRGNFNNIHLQRSWDKYGEENFSFEVLFWCNISMLTMFEQLSFNFLDTKYGCYNEAPFLDVPFRGKKHSDLTRLRLSKMQKGQKRSPRSESTKQKIREKLLGRKHSDERRQKQSEAKLGSKNNRWGKHHSDETKRKISDARKAWWRGQS